MVPLFPTDKIPSLFQYFFSIFPVFLPPANEICEGYVFTGVCLDGACMVAGGACMVGGGGHAWLWGGMHGCQGVCMVAGGCAWLQGAMHGCRGVCMVVGGMHGCGGCAWLQGVCMVVGGCAWLRGACVVAGGHARLRGACVVAGGACIGHDEIRSMSGRYASYWNAFLLSLCFLTEDLIHLANNTQFI